MKECREDVAQNIVRHRELLGHRAALSRTKERITTLAERVDTITSIWRVVGFQLFMPYDYLLLNSHRFLAEV